jgi:hypothetical protein
MQIKKHSMSLWTCGVAAMVVVQRWRNEYGRYLQPIWNVFGEDLFGSFLAVRWRRERKSKRDTRSNLH